MLLTGLLNRWHLAHEDKVFATVIPGREQVHIRSHKGVYPQIEESMSYSAYEQWIKENDYEEVSP